MDPRRDKYDDRHIRDDPTLIDVAKRYVRDYTGDFLVLREMRDALGEGRDLNVIQVRTALNCMRHDIRVTSLPVPRRPNGVAVVSDVPRLHLLAPTDEETRHPARIKLAARWHREFGTSTNRRAELVHRFDTTRSEITYYPRMVHERFHRRFTTRLYWVCGADVTGFRDGYPNIQLLDVEDVNDLVRTGRRRLCARCNDVRKDHSI